MYILVSGTAADQLERRMTGLSRNLYEKFALKVSKLDSLTLGGSKLDKSLLRSTRHVF